MIYALSSIAAILSGVFAAMGFGGGSIFIIYLTLFENLPQTLAQGINLIFFIPISITALIIHNKKNLVDWKYAIIFGILGICGAIVGSILVSFIDAKILSKIFGVFLLFMGLMQFKK